MDGLEEHFIENGVRLSDGAPMGNLFSTPLDLIQQRAGHSPFGTDNQSLRIASVMPSPTVAGIMFTWILAHIYRRRP
jgi:hypothetical protein